MMAATTNTTDKRTIVNNTATTTPTMTGTGDSSVEEKSPGLPPPVSTVEGEISIGKEMGWASEVVIFTTVEDGELGIGAEVGWG